MNKKEIVFFVTTLFIISAFSPIISSKTDIQNIDNENLFVTSIDPNKTTSLLTFYTFDKTGRKQNTVELPSDIAIEIKDLFDDLEYKIVNEPTSIETQELKNNFIDFIDEYGLLTEKQSKENVFSLLNPGWLKQVNKNLRFKNSSPDSSIVPLSDSYFGKSFFCSVSGAGTGIMIPLFMLPRPRAVAFWFSVDAISAVASLLTGKGFLAGGIQSGLLLGFMGIGLTYAIPGEQIYGFIGYSIFAGVTAQYMEFLPPNREPVVSNENPENNAIDVPINLSELSFKITDEDGDPMDYQVTTYPNIGSGEGLDKKNGIYTIPINGLEVKTEYSWSVTVSDGIDTIKKIFSFTTAAIAPIVSNPNPTNGEMEVPISISNLSFTLKDYQGDLMDYTVETSPDIGSGGGQDVTDGTYSVSVAGLNYSTKYYWFVNATDGVHWTNKVFSFQTEFVMVFDPFEDGWQYRKQIIIDHNMVSGDLVNFPVLISTVDLELKEKAQADGDDILFMDGTGIANKLNHEIENYDGSSAELVAWVKIPSLSNSQDKVFYMYYGNPNCSSQQFPEKVWNIDFSAVWHLNNNPIDDIFDSTNNSNDATSYGLMDQSDLVEGKVGKCLQFDGIDDYVGAPDSSSLCPKNVTLSGWYKPFDYTEGGYVISKASFDYWGNADGHTYGFHIIPESKIEATFERDDSLQVDIAGNFSTQLNQWHYLTLTYDDTENVGKLYVNGVLKGTVGPCHQTVLWYYKPWDFIIGASRQLTGSSKIPNFFQNCVIDEVQILSTAKTSGWILTEYNNQNNPLGFLSFGPEETHP